MIGWSVLSTVAVLASLLTTQLCDSYPPPGDDSHFYKRAPVNNRIYKSYADDNVAYRPALSEVQRSERSLLADALKKYVAEIAEEYYLNEHTNKRSDWISDDLLLGVGK